MKTYARYQHEAALAPELVQAHISIQTQELTESQLLERCRQLRNTILACDYVYYGLNSSVVNDFVYDALRRELKYYEQQYPEVVRTLGEFVASERVGSELLEEPTLLALLAQLRDGLGYEDFTHLFALAREQAQTLLNILEEASVKKSISDESELEELAGDGEASNLATAPEDVELDSNVRYIELVQKKSVYTPDQLVKFFADVTPEQIEELMQPFAQQSLNHVQQMLSLSNVYEAQDFLNFVSLCRKALGLDEKAPLELCAEPKLDGIACSIVYENGKIARAVTRGDGVKGFDITNHVKRIPNVPQSLEPFVAKFEQEGITSTLEVRGELIMFQEEFDYLNQLYRAHNKKPLVNLRNSAGAFVSLDPFRRVTSQSWVSDVEGEKRRSLNLAVVDNLPRVMPIRFCAYSVNQYQVGNEYFLKGTHYDLLMYMRKLGFTVSQLVKKVSSVKEYLAYYDDIRNQRESLGFDIDGTVFKVNDLQLQSNIGWIANSPKWAVAFKFPPSKATTVIENVVTQVGRLGSISPIAKVATCFLSGVNISSISLHNHYLFKGLQLHQGDTVVIYRGGEVIPVLKEALVDKRQPNAAPMQILPFCPECGEFLDSNLTSHEIQTEVKTVENGLSYNILGGFMDFWGASSFAIAELIRGKITAQPSVKVVTKVDVVGNAFCNAASEQYCGGRTRQQIEYFFSKNGIEVKGIGSSFIDFGVYLGYLQSYADVYKLLDPQYRQAANSKIVSFQSLYPVFALNYYNQALQLESLLPEFEQRIAKITQEVNSNPSLSKRAQLYTQQRQRISDFIDQSHKLEFIFAPLDLETKHKHLISQIVNYPRYELINFSKYLLDQDYALKLQVPLTLEERLLQSKTDKLTETFFGFVNEYEALNYQAQLFINSLQWLEHLPDEVLGIAQAQKLPPLNAIQEQKLHLLQSSVSDCLAELVKQTGLDGLDLQGLYQEIALSKVTVWQKLITLLQGSQVRSRNSEFTVFSPHKYQGKGQELIAKLIAEFGQWMTQGYSCDAQLTDSQIDLAAGDPLMQWKSKYSESELQKLYAEFDKIAHESASKEVAKEIDRAKKESTKKGRANKVIDTERIYEKEFRKKRASSINSQRCKFTDFNLCYLNHPSDFHEFAHWIEYLAVRLWTTGQALSLSRAQFMLLLGVMQSQLIAGIDLESIYGADYLERFRVILSRVLINRKGGFTKYRTYFKEHGDNHVGFKGEGNYTTQPIATPQQAAQQVERDVESLRLLRKLLLEQQVIARAEFSNDSVLMLEQEWQLEDASKGFTPSNLSATSNVFATTDWVWQREYERTLFAPLFTEQGLSELVGAWQSRQKVTQQLISKLLATVKLSPQTELVLRKVLPLLLNDGYVGTNIKALGYLQQELLKILAGVVEVEVNWQVGDNLISWISKQNWDKVEELKLGIILDLIVALLAKKITIAQLENCAELGTTSPEHNPTIVNSSATKIPQSAAQNAQDLAQDEANFLASAQVEICQEETLATMDTAVLTPGAHLEPAVELAPHVAPTLEGADVNLKEPSQVPDVNQVVVAQTTEKCAEDSLHITKEMVSATKVEECAVLEIVAAAQALATKPLELENVSVIEAATEQVMDGVGSAKAQVATAAQELELTESSTFNTQIEDITTDLGEKNSHSEKVGEQGVHATLSQENTPPVSTLARSDAPKKTRRTSVKKVKKSQTQLEKAQEVLEKLAESVNTSVNYSELETSNDLEDMFGDMEEFFTETPRANCEAISELAVAQTIPTTNFLTRVAQLLETSETEPEVSTPQVAELCEPEINLSDSFFWLFLEDYAYLLALISCKDTAKILTSLKSSYSSAKIFELCGNEDVQIIAPQLTDCSSLTVLNYLIMNFSTDLGVLQAGKSTFTTIREQVLNAKPFLQYYRFAQEKIKAELSVGIFALQDLVDEYQANDLLQLIENRGQKFYLSLNVRNQLVKSCIHYAHYLEKYPAYALSYAPRYKAYLQMLCADRRQRFADMVTPLGSSYTNEVATSSSINQTTQALIELDNNSSYEQLEQVAGCFRQLFISQAKQFAKIDSKRKDGEFSGKAHTKIFEALEKRKHIYLEDFIKSIGIDNLGEASANCFLMQDLYPSIEYLINFDPQRLNDYLTKDQSKENREKNKLSGIGKEIISSFVNYFSIAANRDTIRQLVAQGVEIKERSVEFTNKFQNKKVAITGTLQALGRKQFADFIKESGGLYSATITNDTKYLVVAGEFNPDGTGLSTKVKKAMASGKTEIVTESEFMEIYNSSKQLKNRKIYTPVQ